MIKKFFLKSKKWLLDDCSIVPNDIKKIKKILLELISNTTILNIKFYSMKLPATEILQNLQGTKQMRGLDNVEYGIAIIANKLAASAL